MDDLFDIDISGFNSEEETQIWRAILNKMDYEIDEDSVDINSQKDEATVDVVLNYIDIAPIASDPSNYESLDTFLIEIDEASLEDYEFTLELELDGDEWEVTNSKKIQRELSEILYPEGLDISLGFSDSSFLNAYNGHTWYMAENTNHYYNATYIDFWGTYDFDQYDGTPQMYFEVEQDGVLVFTSDLITYPDCYFYTTDYPNYTPDYLPAGTYTVSLYLIDGTLIDSDSCYVDLATGEGEDAGVSNFVGYDTDTAWYDSTTPWANTIEAWGWYDYMNDGFGEGYYYTTDAVEYDLYIGDNDGGELYYAYYYFPDGIVDMAEVGEPYCDGTTSFAEYSSGRFYEFVLSTPQRGVYYIVVAESEEAWDNGNGEFLVTSQCVVN